jgi:predicted transcriptional regulator
MIDFACKKLNVEDVVKCSLGLSRSDFNILRYLLRHNQAYLSTDKIAEDLSLNLSTVQRAVKKLYERKMIIRSQENLDGGGYIFKYRMKNKEAARKVIMDIIHEWSSKVESQLCNW